MISSGRFRASARTLLLFGTAAVAGVNIPAQASAAAFYLQEQSVKGWGRANSGETADRGPASLWWNPAAIGGTRRTEISFGATGFLPRGHVRDNGTQIDRPGVAPVPVGGAADMSDPTQRGVAPNFAIAYPVSDRVTLGFVLASPFTFTTDYDPSGWQRYSAIRTRLMTLNAQPSIAVAPNDWLSLGAALNVEYAEAVLSNALPNLAAGLPDARARTAGKDVSFGWSAGVQLRPDPRLSFGIGYKSAISHTLVGSVAISGLLGPLAARNIDAPTTANFSLPWQLSVGARAGVTDRLTLNAQVVRYGWSKFDRIAFGSPLNTSAVENYRNSWSYAFGVDAEASSKLTLRAGIQFDGTPTRNDARDARVPDSDRVDYNVGGSFHVSDRLTLDGAIALADFKKVAITRDEHIYAGTAAQTDILTEGRAVGQHAIVASIGGRVSF
jgi:long-chain fatty acid transport protein